jgi:hypothetical protein
MENMLYSEAHDEGNSVTRHNKRAHMIAVVVPHDLGEGTNQRPPNWTLMRLYKSPENSAHQPEGADPHCDDQSQ